MTWKKWKNLQETKSLLHKERLKEKLGKQDFHYGMEEVFEPVTARQTEATAKQIEAVEAATEKQLQASEKQLQALRESSLAIQECSNTLQKSIKEGIQEYDEITNRNNQILTSFVNSHHVNSSIVKTVSNLLNDKNLWVIQIYSQLSHQIHNKY